MAMMEIWQRRDTKLYSATWNRNHMIVDPIRTAADMFLFLHNSMSATVNITKINLMSFNLKLVCFIFSHVTNLDTHIGNILGNAPNSFLGPDLHFLCILKASVEPRDIRGVPISWRGERE